MTEVLVVHHDVDLADVEVDALRRAGAKDATVTAANGEPVDPRSASREDSPLATRLSDPFVTRVTTGLPWVIAGTTLFVVSDSILGWGQFVHRKGWMPVAIMVTYHGAIGARGFAALFYVASVLAVVVETVAGVAWVFLRAR